MQVSSRRTVIAVAILCHPLVCISLSKSPPGGPHPHLVPPPEMRVDINHASVEELIKVPGMTRSWAGRIVRFRPYRIKTDLLEDGVLPSEVYNRIKDYVIAHRAQP